MTSTTTRKGLRGRFFIGLLGSSCVSGKVEKAITPTVLAVRLWSWKTGKPGELRVIDLRQPGAAANFTFYNTLAGFNKAKASVPSIGFGGLLTRHASTAR